MWNLLSEISVTNQWVWTSPTSSQWFRFEFLQQQEVRVDIVAGDGLTLFEMPIRVTTNNPQILEFRRPPLGISSQCIAVRTGDRTYRNYALPWSIKVFTSDEESSMPLFSTSQPITSTIATPSTVAASTTSVELLAANPARKGAQFWNTSPSTLFVKLGSAASATSYSFQMGTGDYYEVPYGFTGAIDGLWQSAIGNVLITELT